MGGGIFVLAGVAYAATGPAAVIAFALNGAIAALTALSFAEMSTAFPESGGPYMFAKRVLSVRAAFGVGWILWFAYIVAAVLYAIGFASYGAMMIESLWEAAGGAPPGWLRSRPFVLVLALSSAGFYLLMLLRRQAGGGQLATIGKVVVFVILVVAGAVVALFLPASRTGALTPFFSAGTTGFLAAMGFTFIAVQGFDLISAVAGEVKAPRRTIPRAMLMSLGLAMVIYLPLLLLAALIGIPEGTTLGEMSRAHPDTFMALAVETYLGRVGYWLVVVAAVLSTLSALQANVLAASRVALKMAQERTLPRMLGHIHEGRGTPVYALYATGITIGVLLLLLPDLAAAGAAASLIFLIAFALAHLTGFLARRRGSASRGGFLAPWFPAVPVVAGVACAALAVFQAVAVPSAGAITLAWLGLGVLLYLSRFSTRAEAVDARAEVVDPELVRLRGRSPLVLVPVANPAHARALVATANALAPPEVGRVMLLSVVVLDDPDAALRDGPPAQLASAQQSLSEALIGALSEGKFPEALLTVAAEPWPEIVRVADIHRCEGLLLGFRQLPEEVEGSELEHLLGELECDVAVLRAPPGWELDAVRRILVPLGGRGRHDRLRARMIGSLTRRGDVTTAFLRVVPADTTEAAVAPLRDQLLQLASEEVRGKAEAKVVRSDDALAAIVEAAHEADLVVLGVRRVGRHRKVFGELALRIAAETETATLMLSARG